MCARTGTHVFSKVTYITQTLCNTIRAFYLNISSNSCGS